MDVLALESLATYSCPVYMTGDFDIYVNDWSDKFTMELERLFETFRLQQRLKDSTHRRGGTLDLLVCPSDLHTLDLHVSDGASSDHLLLSCFINLSKVAPTSVQEHREIGETRYRHVSFRSGCYPRRRQLFVVESCFGWWTGRNIRRNDYIAFWTNSHRIDLSHFVFVRRAFGSMMNAVLQKDGQDFESGITSRANYLQTERCGLHSYVNTIVFAKRREPYSGGFK